jgi:hypothetical protein
MYDAVKGVGFRIVYRRVFPIAFFYIDFSDRICEIQSKTRRSQPKSIPQRVSAQFQMFATLPKSYNENQFLAHILASLQVCRLVFGHI